MTISEAIEITDRLVPNMYSDTDKVRWLMELDRLIYIDVIETHHGGNNVDAPDYSAADMSRTLIIPEPYAEDAYVNFLSAKIALNNGESEKYNTAMTLYNDGYERYAKAYNEKHRPKGVWPFFRF